MTQQRILLFDLRGEDDKNSFPGEREAERFTALFKKVTTQIEIVSLNYHDGDRPTDLAGFDGYLLSGSLAGTYDTHPWISELRTIIPILIETKKPITGICFGHQIIADTLGGACEKHPGGATVGALPYSVTTRHPWMSPLPDTVVLYAAHSDQVTTLPPGSTPLLTHPRCRHAGYTIGSQILCLQPHPEFTRSHAAQAVEDAKQNLANEAYTEYSESLASPTDSHTVAEWIARFFERR